MGQLVVLFPLIQKRIPLLVRTQSWCHRAIYIIFMLGYFTLLVFMDRSSLWRYKTWWNQKGAVMNVPHTVALAIAVLLCAASYFILQASDPGYLTPEVEKRYRDRRAAREESSAGARQQRDMEMETVVELDEDGEIVTEEAEAEGASGGAAAAPAPAASAAAAAAPLSPPSPREEYTDSSYSSSSDEESDVLLNAFAIDMDGPESEDDWGVVASPPDGDDWPIRSHYVRALNARVAVYDHFCGCVGTPIGERNRCKAWVATALHFCVAIWAFFLQILTYHQINHLNNFWHYNWMTAIATTLIVPICIYLSFMLVIFTLNILTNMTTYELLKGSLGKIKYLWGTEVMDIPFSGGVCDNLWLAIKKDGVWNDLPIWCCQDGRRVRGCGVDAWEPHDYPPIKLPFRKHNNCYRNKYWSCC